MTSKTQSDKDRVVIFDTTFKSAPGDVPPPLSPTSPRPELHFLRLPFRF